MRELALGRLVQRGLEDADAGHMISDDEIKRKIDSWQP
jgi:predicted transcriptional regulator